MQNDRQTTEEMTTKQVIVATTITGLWIFGAVLSYKMGYKSGYQRGYSVGAFFFTDEIFVKAKEFSDKDGQARWRSLKEIVCEEPNLHNTVSD